jgi:integrase/recombinase XerD
MNESDTSIMPIPFERLSTERPALYQVEEPGPNRMPVEICTIGARNDIDAIQIWLDEQSGSRTTLRAYTKEVERFYNWLVLIRHKSLGCVTCDDITAYRAFMAAPFPQWCGPRSGRRHTSRWRPFEKALSSQGQEHAQLILRSCFSYLVEVRYLSRNPSLVARRRRTNTTDTSPGESRAPPCSISTFEKLLDALRHQITLVPPTDRVSLIAAERQLFVVQFLGSTGLRSEELARAKMSDFVRGECELTRGYHWAIGVNRGSDIDRIVIINGDALEAVHRYRIVQGASNVFAGDGSPLLLPSIGKTSARQSLTGHVVYDIVRNAIKVGQLHYSTSDPEVAAQLSRVTPHWFRRIFMLAADRRGATPSEIQIQLGHQTMNSIGAVLEYAEKFGMLDVALAFKNNGV